MFEWGSWELVLIFVVMLLVIGPKELPGLAYSVGNWLRYFRNLLKGLRHDLDMMQQQQRQPPSSSQAPEAAAKGEDNAKDNG